MSEIKVDTVVPRTNPSTLTIGASGDTITIPSGATFTQSGTMNASAITAGTMATARLGSGTASSSTFLRGDQTYAAAGGDNTPSFYSYIDSNVSAAHNTQVLIPFNQEVYDIGGCFNNTGSNATLNGLTCPPYGFCPNVAGYYYFNAQVHWADLNAAQQAAGEQEVIQIYNWFSAEGGTSVAPYKYHYLAQINENTNHIFYFNGTGNCMQMKAYQANNTSTTRNLRGVDGNPMTGTYTTYLHGFKLIT